MSKHEAKHMTVVEETTGKSLAHPGVLPQTTVAMTTEEKLYPVARLVHGMTKPENKQNPNGPDFVQGDMVLYPSKQKIGDLKTPFNVIFLRNTLEWASFEEVQIQSRTREEWRGEEPRTNSNEDLPFEYTQDGKKMKRYRQVTLYVLLPNEVETFLKGALSDEPTLGGSVTPVAIKTRNYSRKFAQQIMNVIGSDEFVARNRVRVANGKEPIPVYVYEHVVQAQDFTNKKGDTFPIITYKKTGPVQSKEVLEYAAHAYAQIMKETKLATVVVEDVQEATSRGTVSDEI